MISQNAGTIRAFRYHTPSIRISIDKSFDSVSPDEYDALLPPGGALNADALRAVSAAQAFATAFDHADKPIAAICHAPRLLASTNLLAGRTLASFHAIHDDLENAGGRWCDAPVVNDGNLITSRQPGDLPQFNARMIALFSGSRARLAGGSP
ncbi:MAG: DJ-1/PfpI family protein [Candidatus Velthaea sp.]